MAPKEILKALVPKPVLRAIQRYRARKKLEAYKGLTTQQVFTKIYEEGAWGRPNDSSHRFYSGSGSHDQSVATYIEAVRAFLRSFDARPDVVDLGCGDFHVGSCIRSLCASYIACDIVPGLIAFNKEKYRSSSVDFRVLDLTEDELPKADIVFIRQVLQHLSNDQIQNAIPRIARSYKYLVLTEHVPIRADFRPNLDKPAGPDIRLDIGSGLVLTMPPFDLKPKDERVLCEVPEYSGLIRTTVYTL